MNSYFKSGNAPSQDNRNAESFVVDLDPVNGQVHTIEDIYILPASPALVQRTSHHNCHDEIVIRIVYDFHIIFY